MVGGGGSISVWEEKVHVDTGTWQTHMQFQWGYDLCENRGAEHGARGRVGRIRAAQIYAGLGSISLHAHMPTQGAFGVRAVYKHVCECWCAPAEYHPHGA